VTRSGGRERPNGASTTAPSGDADLARVAEDLCGARFASVDGTFGLAYDLEYGYVSTHTTTARDQPSARLCGAWRVGRLLSSTPEPIGQVVPAGDEVVAFNTLTSVF
jgi:hypothetical protein